MPRRRRPAGLECLDELARKTEILERELSLQRDAMQRLKEIGERHASSRGGLSGPPLDSRDQL